MDVNPSLGTANSVFPWLAGDAPLSERWTVGAILFALGLVGALITVYLAKPGDIPRLGGAEGLRKLRVELEDALEDLERKRKIRDRAVEGQGQNLPEEVYQRYRQDYTDAVERSERARKNLEAQARTTLRYRVPLFVFLGGFVALLLASNALQAIVLGASWPLTLAAIGLRNEIEGIVSTAARQARDEVNDEINYARRQLELEAELINDINQQDAQTVYRALARALSVTQRNRSTLERGDTFPEPVETANEGSTGPENVGGLGLSERGEGV